MLHPSDPPPPPRIPVLPSVDLNVPPSQRVHDPNLLEPTPIPLPVPAPVPTRAEAGLLPGQLISNKWRLIQRIGRGAFGDIFVGVGEDEQHYGKCYAVKLEKLPAPGPVDPNLPPEEQEAEHEKALALIASRAVLKLEAVILSKLQRYPCVSRFIEYGRDMNHSVAYLIMTLLGENLLRLRRRRANGKFTLPTILRFGIQAIRSIQAIHEIGFIHRDIKPSNFVIGSNRGTLHGNMEGAAGGSGGRNPSSESNGDESDIYSPSRIFLIDFGLARCYRDRSTGQVLASRGHIKGFRGTPRYASVHVHREEDLGRRDDLWSLFYILVEFATGDLPWGHQRDKDEIGKIKEEFMSLKLLRTGEPGDIPSCFVSFMKHLYSLKFESKPNYAYLIELLQLKLRKLGYGWCEGDGLPSSNGDLGLDAHFDWEDVETRSTLNEDDTSVSHHHPPSHERAPIPFALPNERENGIGNVNGAQTQTAATLQPSAAIRPEATNLQYQMTPSTHLPDNSPNSSTPILVPSNDTGAASVAVPIISSSPPVAATAIDNSPQQSQPVHTRELSLPIPTFSNAQPIDGRHVKATHPPPNEHVPIGATMIESNAQANVPAESASLSAPPLSSSVSSPPFALKGLPLAQPMAVPDSVILSPRRHVKSKKSPKRYQSQPAPSNDTSHATGIAIGINVDAEAGAPSSNPLSSVSTPSSSSFFSKPPRPQTTGSLPIASDSGLALARSRLTSPSPSPSPLAEDLRADLQKQRSTGLASIRDDSPIMPIEPTNMSNEWNSMPQQSLSTNDHHKTTTTAVGHINDGAFTRRIMSNEAVPGSPAPSPDYYDDAPIDGRTFLPSHMPLQSLNDAYLLSGAPDASLVVNETGVNGVANSHEPMNWMSPTGEFAASLAPLMIGSSGDNMSFVLAPISSSPLRFPSNSPMATPQRSGGDGDGGGITIGINGRLPQSAVRTAHDLVLDDSTGFDDKNSDSASNRSRSSQSHRKVESFDARLERAAMHTLTSATPSSDALFMLPPASSLNGAFESSQRANSPTNVSFAPPVITSSPPISPRHPGGSTFRPAAPPGEPPKSSYTGLRSGRFKGMPPLRSPSKPLSTEQVAALKIQTSINIQPIMIQEMEEVEQQQQQS